MYLVDSSPIHFVNSINSITHTLLDRLWTLFDALFSTIYTVTVSVPIWPFTYLSPGSRRTNVYLSIL